MSLISNTNKPDADDFRGLSIYWLNKAVDYEQSKTHDNPEKLRDMAFKRALDFENKAVAAGQ